MSLTVEDAERWVKRLGMIAPWVGVDISQPGETPQRYVAVDQGGQAVILDALGLTYRRLWGAPPPREDIAFPEEAARSFLQHFLPPEVTVRLHPLAMNSLMAMYSADPLINDMPVVGETSWGTITMRPQGQIVSATAWPLLLEPQRQVATQSFAELIQALDGPSPPRPLADIVLPLSRTSGDPVPIAQRPTRVGQDVGGSVRVMGQALVVEGGPSGREVRAWLETADGTFEIVPVPPTLPDLAAKGDVTVKGTLRRVNPIARWGIIQPTLVEEAPPPVILRGTLDVAAGAVWLANKDGRVLLSGAPLTLKPGTSVAVVGRVDWDGTFRWERIYRAPGGSAQASSGELDRGRRILYVELIYGLQWEEYDPSGLPTAGKAIPAWRVVVSLPDAEESLIYGATLGP